MLVLKEQNCSKYCIYRTDTCQNIIISGTEPLPEGLFWLLLTGDIPTEAQVKHTYFTSRYDILAI